MRLTMTKEKKIDSSSKKTVNPSNVQQYKLLDKKCVFSIFSSGVDRAEFDPLLHLGQVHPHHERCGLCRGDIFKIYQSRVSSDFG